MKEALVKFHDEFETFIRLHFAGFADVLDSPSVVFC
jgi:hypothetical protein